MADKTILDEATEALSSHQWDQLDKSAHGQHGYYGACRVCQGDTEAMAAVVLRVVEERFRFLAEQYRQARPEQTTLGAQWSATEQAMQWDSVADVIAKGLPAGMDATDAR